MFDGAAEEDGFVMENSSAVGCFPMGKDGMMMGVDGFVVRWWWGDGKLWWLETS
ncbi:hypothetical protein LguiB_028171 [Lonicera macranthoides]